MEEHLDQPTPSKEQQQKIEKAKDKRAKQYLDIIEPVRNIDAKVRERQENIFKELPDIKKMSRILRAELKANRVEYPDSQVEDRFVIQGTLFEELVKIENNLYNLATNGTEANHNLQRFTDVENGKVEAELDEQLTILFHNPDRFDYHEVSHLRNPDISFVETDKDGKILRVVGVGEAKSSKQLDKRCLSQFSHFHQNINRLADYINMKDDCDQHGLKHFGRGQDKMTIEVNTPEKFGQYLIVTQNMNIDQQNPRGCFKTQGDGALNDYEIEHFEKMFKEEKVKIRKSSFSHDELNLLVKKIESNIIEENQLEELEFWAEQEAT